MVYKVYLMDGLKITVGTSNVIQKFSFCTENFCCIGVGGEWNKYSGWNNLDSIANSSFCK